ncbi:sugar phosphate isomerase/epimerase family protein [Paenibacillus sabinae]|uniref:Sugar phosphate isomerase/epimerase n=1 Tax=Paenibacillus sabinae T27 TaxID=1268072 RepID=X4ZYG3_9BACL|nr:sugar phosphate isomerase/epimerase [Paenibacillus sabinae]AHV97223.1 sugar phosphate isomerase/epimerase [Paenibacillus sabinae T27]
MLKIGLQLYTLREELEQDFEGTLRKVAALGYSGVEFFHYFGRSEGEVKALLEETGLIAIGAHRPYDVLLENADAEMDYIRKIGSNYLIVPYLSEEQRSDWSRIAANLRILGEKAKQQGVVLLYHNHDFELRESSGGQTAFDYLYSEVLPELLQVEMDTCWVQYGGYDPVEYIGKYAGRLPLIHLKDMKRREDGSAETVVLGEGEVDLTSILKAAEQAGTEWAIVEQDYCSRPALESVAASLEWLKPNYKQGGNIYV